MYPPRTHLTYHEYKQLSDNCLSLDSLEEEVLEFKNFIVSKYPVEIENKDIDIYSEYDSDEDQATLFLSFSIALENPDYAKELAEYEEYKKDLERKRALQRGNIGGVVP